MSYVLSLTSTVKAFRADQSKIMHDETERIGDMLVERIAEHTPIGRRTDMDSGEDLGASGALKRAWRKVPVTQASENSWETGAKNDKDYATYVNDGTRPHIIEPKRDRRMRARADGRPVALRFWGHGELMFRARVHHPGTRGRFMVEQGSMDVEREWPREAEVRMRARAREAEIAGEQSAERG